VTGIELLLMAIAVSTAVVLAEDSDPARPGCVRPTGGQPDGQAVDLEWAQHVNDGPTSGTDPGWSR
jgi:hypothetical protein